MFTEYGRKGYSSRSGSDNNDQGAAMLAEVFGITDVKLSHPFVEPPNMVDWKRQHIRI